jgi:hypothetical protein
MSTRSTIARLNENGSIDAIYCHYDGYPSHNGRILFESYQDPAKINKLLALGDLSILGAELGRKHAFDRFHGRKYMPYQVTLKDGTKVDGCTAYGRDRGETGTEMQHFPNMVEVADMLSESWTEWVYLYVVAEKKWYFTNNPSPTWFKCCGKEQMPLSELTPKAWENR